MKTTRQLFVLTGNPSQVQTVLDALHFKGLTVLKNASAIRDKNIYSAFDDNKSVVCPTFDHFEKLNNSILVHVLDTTICANTTDCIILSTGNISEQFEEIANMHNCDIGDSHKNSSGINGKPTQADCCYCNYISCGYDLCNSRTIYSSKHFFVIPTVGEFCEGYLLIIPYEHVMSSGEFSPEQLEDFNNVLEDIRFLLNLTYGVSNFLVWENGTGNNGQGKAKDSVVHAHIHIAPSNLTAQSIKDSSGFDFQDITWDEITQYGKNSYLLIHDIANKWIINDSNKLYIPRQYIRQLLAEEYNLSEFWNWRKFPFHDFIFYTVQDILTTIIQHQDELPERIVRNTLAYVCCYCL